MGKNVHSKCMYVYQRMSRQHFTTTLSEQKSGPFIDERVLVPSGSQKRAPRGRPRLFFDSDVTTSRGHLASSSKAAVDFYPYFSGRRIDFRVRGGFIRDAQGESALQHPLLAVSAHAEAAW